MEEHTAKSKKKLAVERSRYSAKWATTMTKWLATRQQQGGPKWNLVSFCGPKGGESRGIVNVIAIRKDHKRIVETPLKRGDLFDIVLIQIKGGNAPKPSSLDIERLKHVGSLYHASVIVLSSHKKGAQPTFERLVGDRWEPVAASVIFGKQKAAAKENHPSSLDKTKGG